MNTHHQGKLVIAQLKIRNKNVKWLSEELGLTTSRTYRILEKEALPLHNLYAMCTILKLSKTFFDKPKENVLRPQNSNSEELAQSMSIIAQQNTTISQLTTELTDLRKLLANELTAAKQTIKALS